MGDFAVAINNNSVPERTAGAMVDTESARAIQEVQASMIIAKRFPRDQTQSYTRIMKACERPKLAKGAMYAYPRGGQMITGPSVRLAEAIAQNWGNLSFGIRELSQANGYSDVEAFAWDIETNTRQVKVFRVPHVRHTKKGTKKLNDPRDIYEMVANQGARRLRACILGVIPGDIIEAAVEQCEKTLSGGEGKPIEDIIREMVVVFEKIGVTKEMIEKRLGHNVEATIMQEVVDLRKVYQSIKDGMAKREDFFEFKRPEKTQTQTQNDSLDDMIAAKKNGSNAQVVPLHESAHQKPAPAESGPEDQPEQSEPADNCPPEWERGAWINKRSASFATYVETHIDVLDLAPEEIRKEVRAKFNTLYPGKLFPGDDQTFETNPETASNDVEKQENPEKEDLLARIKNARAVRPDIVEAAFNILHQAGHLRDASLDEMVTDELIILSEQIERLHTKEQNDHTEEETVYSELTKLRASTANLKRFEPELFKAGLNNLLQQGRVKNKFIMQMTEDECREMIQEVKELRQMQG